MQNFNLMGIVIENRTDNAPLVQEILTGYGSIIKMRIGLHDKPEINTGNNGFVILNLEDNQAEIEKLVDELSNIDGVRVRNVKI